MPTAPGPKRELSMMRTPASSAPVASLLAMVARLARWVGAGESRSLRPCRRPPRTTAAHRAADAAAAERRRGIRRSAEDATAGDRTAAVDREEGAGDELALRARQVDDGVGDVLRLAEARQ